MGLFDKLKAPKGFSDEEIDAFVQRLRDKGLTIDTEDEAMQFLNFQSNQDPAQMKKTLTVDETLNISQYTPLYNLWLESPDYHTSEEFNIFEFMVEHIENTHELLKKNFHRLNPDAEFDKFDENKQDLMKFVDRIHEHSDAILKTIDSKYTISDARAIQEIENMKSIEEEMKLSAYGGIDDPEELEKIMNSIINDESFKSLEGFEDAEDLKAMMHDYLDTSETAESDTDIVDELVKDGDLLDKKVDAQVLVGFSRNKVRAWIFILPPRRGGNDITEEKLMSTLDKNGIIYGIDKFAVRLIKQRHPYFKMIQIACGVEPENGTNGIVTENFSRENRTVDLREDQYGQVDYKELNIIKTVHKGDAIADITLPTKAVDGIQVTGDTVKGIDGQYPKIHCGKNVSISADRTKLVADIEGEIFFEDGKFSVKKELVINQDIDASIGNIDFPGDLVIHGSVREGFSVKSEGDLTIKGSVEQATIAAKGHILINQGVNGGKIDAGSSIECQYFEYCTVVAKGNITVDQILGSDVSTEGEIKVIGPNSKIVGGKVFGGNGIEVKYIGNENSNVVTAVTAGMTSAYIEKRREFQSQIAEVEEGITRLRQNINYMKSQADQMNSTRKAFLDKLIFQLNVRNVQKNNILNHIKLIDKRISEVDVSHVEINAQVMNPVVEINFNGVKYTLEEKLVRARVHDIEGTVYLSSEGGTTRISGH